MLGSLILLGVLIVLFSCSSDIVEENYYPHNKGDILEDTKQENQVQEESTKTNEEKESNEENIVEEAEEEIYINNNKLTPSQINELEELYGVKPIPGKYWYDSMSGSYGIYQGASLGVLFPGHEFGNLPADASNGNSGVFINGRELPELDIQFLEWIFGVQRTPGRYWQDSLGNIGVEGSDIPLVNFYVAYAQKLNQGKGISGSKDNYWAANFGSYGNEQNGFGYVMVDGVSVTYSG